MLSGDPVRSECKFRVCFACVFEWFYCVQFDFYVLYWCRIEGQLGRTPTHACLKCFSFLLLRSRTHAWWIISHDLPWLSSIVGTIVTLRSCYCCCCCLSCFLHDVYVWTLTGQGLWPPIRTSNLPACISSRTAGLAGSFKTISVFGKIGIMKV